MRLATLHREGMVHILCNILQTKLFFFFPHSKESKAPGCVWFSKLGDVAGDNHGDGPCCKLL